MQFLDEIPYMRLFSNKKKVYIPVDLQNRRKGSAIMLLTENPVDSTKLMELPYMYNPNLFTGLYIDRNVNAYIKSGAIVDDEVNDPEGLNEAMVHSVHEKDMDIHIDLQTSSSNDMRILKDFFKEKTFMKWYKSLGTPDRFIPMEITVHAYATVKDMAVGANKIALKNKEIAINSYSTYDEIYIVAPSGYKPLEKSDGKYEYYLMNEVITQACMNTSRRCSRFIANSVGTALSGQLNDKPANKIENDWADIKDDKLAVAYTIKKMYDEEGMRPIKDMVKHGDLYALIRYASRNFVRRISGIYEVKLSAADRKKISDADYGLPGQKKYPMPDESHVRSAIRFFNHVDPSDEAELARNINKKIKQYGLDVNVGKDNRFSKYHKAKNKKVKNESVDLQAITELANITDDKIVVGTDFHFIGYNDDKTKITLKPKSYIEAIVKKQNELTGNDGIFIFLGDLLYKAFRNEYDIPGAMKDEVINYIKKFKGKYKILIRGNHDNLPDEFYINTCGFTHICSSLRYGNILFSHQPQIVKEPIINVHGHIHGSRSYIEEKPRYHMDVYVMNKQHLDTLTNIMKAQEEYDKTTKQASNIARADPYQYISGDNLDLDDIVNEQSLLEFDWEPDDKIAKSKVYFTNRITPDSLVEIYKALGIKLNGKVAVKISTGEPGKGPRYCLNPQLIQKFVNSLDGTIVECNVAYEGPRHTTEAHWETIKKHGYYDIAPCDILDEDGDYSIPVENGLVLKNVLAGNHMKNYDSFVILSHFKGHAMGGYGGALKNVAIGLSSADGKKIVHSGGHVTEHIAGMIDDGGMDSADKPVHDLFLRSMADANRAFGKEMRTKGNPVVYINVANNISVDCDCDPEPHAPTMKDIGIFASLDPVAVDQAAIDAVYAAPDSDDVIERIESRHGLRTIEYAMELGLGNRDYDLIDIDKQVNKAKVNISVNRESVLQEVKFENDKGEKVPKTCPKCGAKVGVFFRGEPVFLCSNKDCGKYFGTVPFKESAILEGNGGTKLMNLDKFISVPMTPQNIRFYKDQAKGLSHIRTGDNCKGKIFIENKDGERRVVGFYNTETKSNGEVWLQAIEVMPDYRSQGIGKLLLQDAVKEGAKYLAVAKNNTRAKSMYINHGFKSYERTDKMVFMKLESTTMSIPLPVRSITESMNDDGYIFTEDYIMDEDSITFFNGMNEQVISEAEKKYDSKLKKYLFQERLKNNKAVVMRYQEMKAMCPWIKKTYLKLSMYRGYNIFIDLSYYHGLFLKHLNLKKDVAINMYWDFINRLLNESEYKDTYHKITILIPVYPGAWDVDDPIALMDYKQSINPISMIIRILRRNPDKLKAWGNKDIVFVSPKGFFKVNFSNFNLKNLAKFKKFISKLATYEDIVDDEEEDGYGNTEIDADSPAVITAKITDKIEKNTGIQIDDIAGNSEYKPDDISKALPTKVQVDHLRIRTGKFSIPASKISPIGDKPEETNTVFIMAPNDDATVEAVKNSVIDSNLLFNNKGFYTP